MLFEAIRHHLQVDPSAVCVVYTGDVAASESLLPKRPPARWADSSSIADGGGQASGGEILSKARDRFDIDLTSKAFSSRIAFLPLRSRALVSDGYWKRLTMLGQSFGGAVLAKEACEELIPDYFIDTMGYAFAFPVVRLFRPRCPICAYVHYPTISTDMLERVRSRKAGHTNDAAVAGSIFKSQAKLVYYRIFAMAYSWALRRADAIAVNGSWTQNHVNRLILSSKAFERAPGPSKETVLRKESDLRSADRNRKAQIVYPPCDTRSLEIFSLTDRSANTIVSLAQFRPEKEHSTQLKLLRAILDRQPSLSKGPQPLKLTMMGSSRNPGDEARIASLRALTKELNLEAHVEFIVNAPYSVILRELSKASIGLSTMVDEHFGINVVEFMAAGLITLSHASAGPLLDIAVPDRCSSDDDDDGDNEGTEPKPTGLHASDVDEFAAKAEHILVKMSEGERLAMRKRARSRAQRTFSAEAFREAWDHGLWQRLQEKAGERKVVRR